GTAHFVERLRRFGPITMLRATLEDLPLVLLPPESQATELVVRALRVPSDFAESAIVRAVDADGYEVGSLELIFEPGEEQAAAPLELPLELRNRIERLRIERRSEERRVGKGCGSRRETARGKEEEQERWG